MEQNQKKVQKKRTFSAYITSLAVLSFLLVFTLNLLATRLDIVWDMTPSGMYQLTDTSKDMLSKLDKRVNFYFLLQPLEPHALCDEQADRQCGDGHHHGVGEEVEEVEERHSQDRDESERSVS